MSTLVRTISVILLSALCGVLVLGVFAYTALAQPSYTINYQGKLTDNTGLTVPNGTYEIEFNLYTQSTGGVAIWTETRSGGNEVTVENGLFSVMLGSVSSLAGVNFNQPLYLGVTIEADAEMTPRKAIGSVPSAFEAKQLGGVASSSFLRSDQADTASGLLTFTNGFISNASSSISMLNASSVEAYAVGAMEVIASNLTVNGDTFNDLTGFGLTNNSGVLTVATSTLGLSAAFSNSAQLAALLSDETGSGGGFVRATSPSIASATLTGTSTVTGRLLIPIGSQSAPTLTFDTDSDTGILGNNDNSIRFTTGGTQELTISSDGLGLNTSHIKSNTVGSYFIANTVNNPSAPTYSFDFDTDTGFYRPASNNLAFATAGTERLRIDGNGNVGIGTSTLSGSEQLTLTGHQRFLSSNATIMAKPTVGHVADLTIGAGRSPSDGTKGAYIRFRSTGTGDGEIAFGTTDQSCCGGIQMTLTKQGNFGIGTTSPNQRLTVQGNINLSSATGGIYFDDTRYLYASSTNDSITFGENAGATFTADTGWNVAIGHEAGRYASTTNSDANTFIGWRAGYENTGQDNYIIGQQAGYENSGNQNNILGYSAGYSNTGDENNIFGYFAGLLNTGFGNNILGSNAGEENTGNTNNLFGYYAGNLNTGDYNNILGYQAGFENRGSYNNFIGYEAGAWGSFYGGSYNEFIGYQAGDYLTGTSTVAIGARALSGGDYYTAVNNVAIGYGAGRYATNTADNNILIGYQVADNLSTGNNNIIIGYDIDNVTATADNRLNIGNLIFGTGLDGTGTTLASGNVGIGTTSPYAKLSVTNTGSGPSFLVEDATSPDSSPFIIDASGQVAIGTTTPMTGSHLTIQSSGTESSIYLINTSDSSRWSRIEQTSLGYLEFDSSTLVLYRVGGTEIARYSASGLTINENSSASVDFRIESDTDTHAFFLDATNGRIGIGTSTPWKQFSVAGDMVLSGGLFDSNASAGTAGMVLQTTGTGVTWVATSSLGISGGGGSSLFTDGGANTYLTATGDNLSVGGTGGSAKLNVYGDIDITDGSAYKINGIDILSNNFTSDSLAIGEDAGNAFNNTGIWNVAIGYQAGYNSASTTASDNMTAVGAYSASANTGESVSAFGRGSAYQNTGSHASAFGVQSAYQNTGGFVSAFGFSSAYQNTGIQVAAFGLQSAYLNTGDSLSAFGVEAARENTGEHVSAFGIQSAEQNVNGFVSAFGSNSAYQNSGWYVSAFGVNSAYQNTGSYVSAFGEFSARYNTGNSVSALGYNSAYQNTGDSVTAIGNYSAYGNTSDYVSAFGYNSLRNIATSTAATVFGYQAGRGDAGGAVVANLTAFGYQAGLNLQTGADNNLLIGYQAGDNITTGNNNIIIGYDVDSPTATADNRLNIGNLIFGTGLDGTGTTLASGNVGIGTTTPSQKLSVAGDILLEEYIHFATTSQATFGFDYNHYDSDYSGFSFKIGGSEYLSVSDNGLYTQGQITADTGIFNSSLSVFGNMSVTGTLGDSSGDAGTNGQVLLSTGTGTNWVATSSLGISGGGGMSIGSAITSGTNGSALFVDGGNLAQDNTNFFWDNTNKRLGLGDNTPDAVLDIQFASVSATAGTEFGSYFDVFDVGAVNSGTDTTVGQRLDLTRTGATGGTLVNYGYQTILSGNFSSGSGTVTNYGHHLSVTGTATGNSTNYGTYVTVSGADTNYSGAFLGGNFGIGDATPSQLLDIDGTNPQILTEESTTEFFRAGVGETSNESIIGWDDSDALRLGLYSSPTDTTIDTKLSILANGNVGIGTTTPGARLGVTGNMLVTGTTTTNGLVSESINTDTITSITSQSFVTFALQLMGSSISIGGLGTGMEGNNFFASQGLATTDSDFIFNGASGLEGIAAFNIDQAIAVDAGHAASILSILGEEAFQEASSGNHPLISSLALKPPTITSGSATVSNTATLYIQGAPSATVSGANMALWVDAGNAIFDGSVGIGDTTPSQLLDIDGTNPQFLAEESTTEFLRAGVGETGNTSVIGWDDGDTLHLGVYSSPTDTGIDSLFAISGSTGNITMPGSLSADTGTVTALDLVALDTLDIAGTFTVSNLGVITSSNNLTPDAIFSTGQADEECLTYESTGDTFEWQSCGGGGSLFTDGGANTYLTATGDNLSIGGTGGSAKLNVYGNLDIANGASGISFMGTRFFYASSTNNSIAIGDATGGAANSGNTYNVAIGNSAMLFNGSGDFNVAIGTSALSEVNGSSYNTAVGTGAQTYGGGTYNVSLGYYAGVGSGSGYTSLGGVYIGAHTGSNLVGSNIDNNVFIGYQAGTGVTSGENNILLGGLVASNLTSGSNNIIIGYDIDSVTNTASNRLNIGNLIFGTSIDGTGTTLSTGNIGIGTTTPNARFSVQRTGFSGAGVIGTDQWYESTNSTLSAIQYGNRNFLDFNGTATTTLVGSMFRLADDTTYGNTIRGLEVQTNQGSNPYGENTAISGSGRTFGIRGITTGNAGSVYEPAGGFFQTNGTTQGNAIRGYSSTITSATLLSLFQDTSTFTGTGLEMNFGNSGGSFTNSGSRFIDLQNVGTSVFTVGAYGTTTIGNGTNFAGLQIGRGGICVDNDGACTAGVAGRIASVSTFTGNSDLAEMYFSSNLLETGEIVTLKGELSIERAEKDSELPVLGVVSTKPGLLLGADDTSLTQGERGYPVALRGRVPIKLSTENGPIEKGDPLTLSSIPGVAMKATDGGTIVGTALEDFDDSRMYSDTYLNQFGDDIAEEMFEPIVSNSDPRIHDGCYYGGGAETGDSPCVPLVGFTPEQQLSTANEVVRDDIVRGLKRKGSKTEMLENGQEVKVGQIVMFVDLNHSWFAKDQMASLASLFATSSITNLGDNKEETLFGRIKNLANNFVDGVLSVFKLKADRVEIKEELCVDGVCIDANDLRELLDRNNVQGSAPSPDPEPTPEPEQTEPEVGEEGNTGDGEQPPTEETPVTDPTPPPEDTPVTPPVEEPEPTPEPTPESEQPEQIESPVTEETP